jgi:hypothetical protein
MNWINASRIRHGPGRWHVVDTAKGLSTWRLNVYAQEVEWLGSMKSETARNENDSQLQHFQGSFSLRMLLQFLEMFLASVQWAVDRHQVHIVFPPVVSCCPFLRTKCSIQVKIQCILWAFCAPWDKRYNYDLHGHVWLLLLRGDKVRFPISRVWVVGGITKSCRTWTS